MKEVLMKKIMDLWLYFYISCIYFLPLIALMRSSNKSSNFLLRRLLFPFEYLIQRRLEKITNYNRGSIRVVHIFIWFFSIFSLMFATAPLIFFHEPLENHTTLLLFITYYCMLAPFCFWFQPRNLKQ